MCEDNEWDENIYIYIYIYIYYIYMLLDVTGFGPPSPLPPPPKKRKEKKKDLPHIAGTTTCVFLHYSGGTIVNRTYGIHKKNYQVSI